MPTSQTNVNSAQTAFSKPSSSLAPGRQPVPGQEPASSLAGRQKIAAKQKKDQTKLRISKRKTTGRRLKKFGLSSPQLIWRLVTAVILGVILTIGTVYSHGQLERLVTEISQRRAQWVALSQKEEDYQLLSSGLAAMREEAMVIQKAFPDEAGLVDFLNQVESLRREQGIEVRTFNFTTDQPQKNQLGNDYVELAIEASGSLVNLERFSDGLLKLPLMIRLKLIRLEKVSEPNSRLVLKAWVFVRSDSFYQTQNEE